MPRPTGRIPCLGGVAGRALLLVAALTPALTLPVAAQVDVDDEEDVGDEGSVNYGLSPRSLDESRETGVSVRLGRTARAVPRVAPESHTVRRGDTLWDITGGYFGNPWDWPRIWSFNPEITNPHWIYPLDRIRLRAQGENPTVLATPDQTVDDVADVDPHGTIMLREEAYLDADAIRASGIIVGSPEEQMLLSPFDRVYIRFDGEPDIVAGSEMTVFRAMQPAERNPEEQGVLVRIFGTVRMETYDRERRVGRAVISEALDPIERGFRVAVMARRIELVPPRRNEHEVEGRVVATLRPQRLLADYQVIFVDKGSEQGVAVGNRFFAVRAGDRWRESLSSGEEQLGASLPETERLEDLPDEIVAEALVVNVRPNSSTLVVTRSVQEVAVGDRLEMRPGY